MPLDDNGFVIPERTLTPDEQLELDVLKRARWMLRKERLWWRGHRRPYNSHWWEAFWWVEKHCVITSVSHAKNALGIPDTCIIPRLYCQLPSSFAGDLIAFNDSLTTTHADVLGLFDRAIAELEV